MASLTIGTKLDAAGVVVGPATLGKSWRIARRQPNTCCEQTCQRRATSDTRAPGVRVSATIRAFSSADQRRRRPGPVRTSTRRNSPFASSLTSNIRIARSPLPPAHQALPGRLLKKGGRAALTTDHHDGRDDQEAAVGVGVHLQRHRASAPGRRARQGATCCLRLRHSVRRASRCIRPGRRSPRRYAR
jgi:hypothetical protein